MNGTSRRKLLGSLGAFALVPLIRTAPELLSYENNGGIQTEKDTASRAQAVDIKVEKVTVNDVNCPSWPLRSLGAVTVQGDPRASGKTVFESGDHQITGGIWQCSPGTFELTFTWDEMALLLEGELIIEESSGHQVHIQPGDFFFVPRGARTQWIVVKPLKKVFFSRE